MSAPVITALYASLSVFLLVILGGYASSRRGKFKIAVGGGDNDEMLRASRAHGNLAEYLGPFIGVLLFAELLGGGSIALHSIGGVFLVGRMCHAYGLIRRNAMFQGIGALSTYLVLTFVAGYGLYLRFMLPG